MEIKLSKRYKYAGDIFPRLLEIGFDKETAEAFLNSIKDANVEEVERARWQWGHVCGQYGVYCSKCETGWVDSENVTLIAAAHKYCPECGARMAPFGK